MSAPLRVAQVVGKMVGGGLEAVVMNYYRHVDRARVQFDLLVDVDSTLVPRAEVESLGGRVIMVPPYQDVLASQRELARLFRAGGWPIVHSHMNALSVFPLRAAARAGVPVRIAHSHSTWGSDGLARNAAKAALRTQANRYPTHRMACSSHAGEWLFGAGADFEVVRNAIELGRFSFDASSRFRARGELGLAGDAFAVLHVGRFMPQKNHRFLIDAFAELVRIRPRSVLVLAGDGGLRPSVEARAADRGVADRVRFLGQRDDAEMLYLAADAFCLPSLYEGLGIVAVEAQRSGCPCLLSEAVPREADVTGRCRFLPVGGEGAARVWAEALARISVGTRLPVRDSDFEEYDIESAAENLTARYLKLERNIGRAR